MEAGFAAHNLAFWRKRRLALTSPSDPLAFPGPSRDPLATPPGAPPRPAACRPFARRRSPAHPSHRATPLAPACALAARAYTPPACPPARRLPPPGAPARPGGPRGRAGGGGCQRAVTGQKHPGLRRIRAARSRFWPKIPRFTRFRLRQVRKTQCFWPEIWLSARAWPQRDRRLPAARPPPACALVARPSVHRATPPACAPTLTRRPTESASSARPPPRARPLVFLVGKFPAPSRAPAPAIL